MAIDETARSRRAQTSAALVLLLAGALASAALALVLAARLRDVLLDASGPWRVDSAVEAGVTGLGTLVAVWLACSALLAAACLVARSAGTTWRAGEDLVQRYAPRLVRKALVLAVGAGLGLGVATGASAAAPDPAPSPVVSVTASTPDDLGWVVTSTTASPALAPARDAAEPPTVAQDEIVVAADAPPPAAAPPADTPVPPALAVADTAGTVVVVVAGDSLWSIAARHLPPGATDAEIAAAWPRWYEANAAVVGADPGVILPGQVLSVPTPAAADGASR